MGISFSGGLSVVAAGTAVAARTASPTSSRSAATTISPRVLRYLCTGREPRPMPDVQLGTALATATFVLPPHDYGVAVILLSLADRVVPAGAGRPAARRRPAVPVGVGARRRRRQGARAGGVRSRAAGSRARCPSRRRRCCATCSSATSSTSARACCRSSDRARDGRAVGLEIAEAVRAGLPAARPRGQRDSRGRIGIPRRGSCAATRRCGCC